MFDKTVTIFNRVETPDGIEWHPKIIRGVMLRVDRALMVQRLGEQSTASASLHIRYTNIAGEKHVFAPGEDFVYKKPKEYMRTVNGGQHGHYLTLNGGNNTDFFMAGAWENDEPIKDEDYRDGFFNYVKKNYDDVFAIVSVGTYDAIPHFEVFGK